MKNTRKNNKSPENDEPKVIAATEINSTDSISRREFLKLTTATLATVAVGPLLSSCAPSGSSILPTSTPIPPSGTINNSGTPLLSYPGDATAVILLMAAGTAVEFLVRDASKGWVMVKIKDGENAGKEGWVKTVEVTFVTAHTMNEIPISNEVRAMPTEEPVVVKTEGKVVFSGDFYSAPGETETVGSIREGDTIEIIERDATDTWFKIKTSSGQVGWIEQYGIVADPEYTTRVTINESVVPVPPPSSGGGRTVTYWYPN